MIPIILPKNRSFAEACTKYLHSSLLSTTDLLVMKDFSPLIRICLSALSQTICLVMTSYVLLYFYLSLPLLPQLLFFNSIENSSPLIPTSHHAAAYQSSPGLTPLFSQLEDNHSAINILDSPHSNSIICPTKHSFYLNKMSSTLTS